MKILSAQDAAKLSEGNYEETTMFLEIISKIENAAMHGDREITYYTAGEHLPDREVEMIRNLGYSIYWNGPCLWYEISW